ncbi:MAG: recombinase family protein, partial [Bacilli bacterium]|nr:recombinase family protein [Bacilli bacterium]
MDLIKIREQLNLGVPLINIKLRVTDYSRVSTNREEQKSSLNNQVNYFNKYIINNPNWEYVEGYIDEGISGTTDYKRTNFMRMIEDAKNNKFDLIITKEISRFSRNTLDSIKYTRELLNYGVAVLFINDNINTALPDSELRLTIMSSLAQDEIRRLSERVKFGMRESINNGNILGNNKLYGYKKINNKLVIVKKESKIIKDIFYKYVIDNYSLNKISKIYNFSVTKISRIIKNPKYKGYYCGRKSEVVDYISKKTKYLDSSKWIMYKDKRIPKIVDEEIWNKANIKLKNNNKKITKNIYPLSKKIYCQKDK